MKPLWITTAMLGIAALAGACVEMGTGTVPAAAPPASGTPVTSSASTSTTPTAAQAATTAPAAPTTAPTSSIVVPSAEVPKPTEKSTDQLPLSEMAWQTFVALNWPADLSKGRGVPLKPNDQSTYKNVTDPRVWETWKQDWETNGKTLSDWDRYEAEMDEIPCHYVVQKDGTTTAVTRDNWPQLYKDVGGGTVLTNYNTLKPGKNVEPGIPFVDAGPLIDENGELVAFEIRFNRELYDCVKSGAGEGCKRDDLKITLPSANADHHGAITLKASWRKVTKELEPFRSAFFVRDVLVVGWEKVPRKPKPLSVCRLEPRALVGMHIVFKDQYIAKGSGQAIPNKWFWATFEQNSNTTMCNALPWNMDKSLPYGFIPATGFSYEPPVLKPELFSAPGTRKPVMLCRVNPFQGVVTTSNSEFQPQLQSYPPWSRYQMVANQWFVSGGFGPPSGVANVTLEPYSQADSCARCHSERAAETDFVWSLNLSAHHQEQLANKLDPTK